MFMSTWNPMPQTQSFPHPHEIAADRMASSLVISSQQSQELSPQSRPGRPKLSLNTAQTRTFGKGSSLRLETLSAISPTIINTFSNAYEPPAAQPSASSSEQKLARPKLSINSSIQYQPPEIPTVETQDSRTPSSASISSASTANSATFPYSNSQILNSILANSPIPRLELPRKMAGRPRFPAEKKVSFRTPLEEEIITTKFTYAHYDVESLEMDSTASLLTISTSSEDSFAEAASSSPSGSSESLSSSHSSQRTEGSYLKQRSMNSLSISSDSSSPSRSPTSPAKRRLPNRGRNKPKVKTARSPRTGEKRDSSSESDSDTCPETPVAGRRKLNRDWVWTLGTLPGQSSQILTDESTTTTTSSSSTSFTSSIASRSDESS
ncbi:hypothetical protein EG328_007000 [Venturia inaequalis]|uniref:Uncharacterized protein n=1 Tax=Venturia inaequalis TaxID=5025 RepID=A0A8H3VPZ3_VENIN|nr:hypothetical protein EG328_007000 [Venturia inaequalis]KAE9991965.1 hypothetical protein EG327_010532 [Venturia inaequalis]RDI84637.1 hypothetical protein Vi05172_g5449 [Venturia inaequalis]